VPLLIPDSRIMEKEPPCKKNDLQGDWSEPPGRCLQKAGFQERTCMNREKSSKNAVMIQCHSVKALWPETILDDCLVKPF